jgi:hypothetical protein
MVERRPDETAQEALIVAGENSYHQFNQTGALTKGHISIRPVFDDIGLTSNSHRRRARTVRNAE